VSKALRGLRLRQSILFLGHDGLNVPYALRILVDTPVTREETHPRDSRNCLRRPLLRVLVALVNELLRLDVRRKVVRHKVVVTVVDDAVEQCREGLRIAKGTVMDAVENSGESRVQLVVLVEVSVTEIVDVFSEVAEEEDVVLANLACNFNLTGSVYI
jgi:hypothetical protein